MADRYRRDMAMLYAPPPPPPAPPCACGAKYSMWSPKDQKNLCWSCILKRREAEREEEAKKPEKL